MNSKRARRACDFPDFCLMLNRYVNIATILGLSMIIRFHMALSSDSTSEVKDDDDRETAV